MGVIKEYLNRINPDIVMLQETIKEEMDRDGLEVYGKPNLEIGWHNHQ